MSNPRGFFSYVNNENFLKNVGLGIEKFSTPHSNPHYLNPNPSSKQIFNSFFTKLAIITMLDKVDHDHLMSIGLGHHHK